jgi:hypothetical protein
MAARLEVITSRDYWKRIKLMYLFCGPFGLLGLRLALAGIQQGGKEGETAPYMLGIALFMLGAPLIFVFARRWWVQYFDEQGVVLRNGRRFSWDRFKRVDRRTRGNLRLHNNYELHFEDGIANVYDLMAANMGEVREVIAELERGENRFRPRPGT